MESVKGRRCRLAFGCCVRLLSELTGRCLRRLRVAMAGPLWLFWFGENMATADNGADVCVTARGVPVGRSLSVGGGRAGDVDRQAAMVWGRERSRVMAKSMQM